MAAQSSSAEILPLLNSSKNGARVERSTGEGVDQVFLKITKRVVPICFLVAFLSHIDRTNLSLAAREFCSDLGLSSSAYGTGVGVFFVFYAAFQIPSNLALEKLGAPRWMGFLMILWGLVASCMAFVRTKSQFFFLRAVLGMAEAGTFPGMWLYLSSFFPEKHRTLPLALMELGITLAQIFGSPIGAILLSLDNLLRWRGWQWLFFLEGLPSVLLGVWISFRLPAGPESAPYLSDCERKIIQLEFAKGKEIKSEGVGVVERFKQVGWNRNLWMATLVKFLRNMTTDVALFWTPLWIHAMLSGNGLTITGSKHSSCGAANSSSHQDALVAGLTSIPFTCTAITSIFLAWHSEKKQERKFHIGIAYITAAVVFVFLPIASEMGIIFGFVMLTVMLSACHGVSGILVSLGSSYLTPETRAIGLALLNSLGHLGGYFGSELMGIMVEQNGGYVEAILVLSSLLTAAGLIVMVLPDGGQNTRASNNKIEGNLKNGDAGKQHSKPDHSAIHVPGRVVTAVRKKVDSEHLRGKETELVCVE
ncbi:hypothetical protein BSKO_08890 [Bryopsis sp. KO-2023]|nr:hypothetical protein BSKO_08890 [Bryopsis sp. KO-2023]